MELNEIWDYLILDAHFNEYIASLDRCVEADQVIHKRQAEKSKTLSKSKMLQCDGIDEISVKGLQNGQ